MSKNLKSGNAGGRLVRSNTDKMARGGRFQRTSRRQQSRLGVGAPAAIYQFPMRIITFTQGGSTTCALYGGFMGSVGEYAENTARKFCEEQGHEYAYNAAGSISEQSDPATWSYPPMTPNILLHWEAEHGLWDGASYTQDKLTWTTIQCTSPGTPYGGF